MQVFEKFGSGKYKKRWKEVESAGLGEEGSQKDTHDYLRKDRRGGSMQQND